MLKKCLQCGKEFNAGMDRIKCCSIDCASKLRTKYKDKICPTCGKKFHPLNATHKFCSPECRLKGTDYKCVCDICGVSFLSKVPYSKYCCDECKKEGMRRKHKKIKCEQCGIWFYPRHNGGKYCCDKCKREARKTIKEKVCPICNKLFLPVRSDKIYCSKECYRVAQSKLRKLLPENKKKEIIDRLQSKNKKAISSENIKYAELLAKEGYNVSFEFFLGGYYYDLKIGDILIEINPFPYHSSNFAPRGVKPKHPKYHYNKAKCAVDRGYKIIEFRTDWMSEKELLYLLQNLKQTILQEPQGHYVHKRTKDHLIDNGYDEEEMLTDGYVKIYDGGEKYIFNNTKLN